MLLFFIHAGEWDSLLMAFWVWRLYGLPGIILNSRKLQFLTFHLCVGSSSTRLSHAQACEMSYLLFAECNSPSDRGYDITAFIPFPPPLSEAGDLRAILYPFLSPHSSSNPIPQPSTPAPHALALTLQPSAPDTQQDSRSWRSYHQTTDYLLICCLAAAGCVKALILQLNFFTEGGTAEHELLYRGNYTSYGVTALI